MAERVKWDDQSLDDLLTLAVWKNFKESDKNFPDANVCRSKTTNPLHHNILGATLSS